jgi:GAF domain-containing protein/AmiR/NasT family two-component response regulator
MTDDSGKRISPRVIVIADVEANAQAMVKRVLTPAGVQSWIETAKAPPCDVLVVDVTQSRGDPLAGLRARRDAGDLTPAIVLAAHFSPARIRDLFRLNVGDVLLKPYRPEDLVQAVLDLAELRSAEANTQILSRKLDTLREQFRRRSDEVRTLSEIGRAVVSLGDLDAILARVVEAAAFLSDAEEANIYLADTGTSDLVLRASKQAGEKLASLQRLRVYDTLVGRVFQTGQPLLHQPSLEGGTVKVHTGFLVQSLIEVPLRVGSRVVGVLGVFNRLAPRAFTNHQLTLMQALSDWAGVALEHASLMNRARSAAPEKAAAGPIALAPQSLVDGLRQAAEGLGILLEEGAGAIAEPQRRQLQRLLVHLQQLGALPVALIDVEAAEGLVDLQEVVGTVVDELKNEAARSEIELVIQPGQKLPHLHTDRPQIRQILFSLISASMRRVERGRVEVATHRFNVAQGRSVDYPVPGGLALRDGMWAGVAVSDNSQGFSPDTLHALTARSADPNAGRSGPGLSMGETRMIAEALGGALWHSKPPSGTCITFALPAA